MRSFKLPTQSLLFLTPIILYFCFIGSTLFAQPYSFDSVTTVASSDIYDYKNPVFDQKKGLAYNSTTWLSYERYKANGASDIGVRNVSYSGYGTEIILTNSVTEKNINPAISDSIVVWQSNKNGNWDIYYSRYNGTSWSQPVLYPMANSQDETNPFIVNNNTAPTSSNYYMIAFKRGVDIFFTRYKTQGAIWDISEINVTDSVNSPCFNPIIVVDGQAAVGFFKYVTDIDVKLTCSRFNISSNGTVNWQGTFDFNYVTLPHRMLLSNAFSTGTKLTFNFNNTVNSIYPVSGAQLTDLTPNIQGIKSNGKGVTMGLITDSPPVDFFTAFGCVLKRNDSAFVILSGRYSNGSSANSIKYKYLGSASVNTNLDASMPLFSQNLYKIRYAWEKMINGKSAIVESYLFDFINEVPELSSPANFDLYQNYPNPFNPSTQINYELRNTNYISLKVFDMLGKEIASLVNEKQNAGSYEVDFNSFEFNLPSGIYFYTLNAGEFKETKKMVLVK